MHDASKSDAKIKQITNSKLKINIFVMKKYPSIKTLKQAIMPLDRTEKVDIYRISQRSFCPIFISYYCI